MKLCDFLSVDRVSFLEATTKQASLDEMCQLISRSEAITEPESFRQAILRREETLSTGIGLGLAIPHAKIESVTGFVLAVGVHHRGLDFDALDKKPVHIVVMVGTPADKQREYLRLLATITHLLKEPSVRQRVVEASDPAAAHAILTTQP